MVTPYNVQFKGIVPGEAKLLPVCRPRYHRDGRHDGINDRITACDFLWKRYGNSRWMLAAPISRLSIILGKVMAQTIRGWSKASLFCYSPWSFWCRHRRKYPVSHFLILLTVFSFVGLGILITSFTDKEETATMVMMTLMFPMMFLSGVFFPTTSRCHGTCKESLKFLPLTYATTALRKVMVLGADVSAVGTDILILIGFWCHSSCSCSTNV